ncbi:MAG: hypothetical protein K2L05_02375 [Muribaculaceae bacterium]|nr:hypothetical protein [Muribaculaceae bacterium]
MILGLAAALECVAEVRYFNAADAPVPVGEVVAVEARAAAGNGRFGQWQLTWPGAEISFAFSSLNSVDGVDHPKATLTVNGSEFVCPDGVDTSGEPNSIAIEWADSLATILIGHRTLKAAATLALPHPTDTVRVSSSAKPFDLIDMIIETNPNSFRRLVSDLSAEQLAQGKRWEYLDRETDPKTATSGGQYILSQIGNDLYYLDGALTNRDSWAPGMLKGRLTPTNFKGYFKLSWFDATGRELSGENYAEINEDLGIMKLTFPALGASMRFHD